MKLVEVKKDLLRVALGDADQLVIGAARSGAVQPAGHVDDEHIVDPVRYDFH